MKHFLWRLMGINKVLFLFLLLFIGCEGTGNIDLDPREPSLSTSDFSGITSVDQINDSSVRILWSSDPSAIGYELYNTVSGIPIFISFIAAPAGTFTIDGLSPATNYSYRLNAKSADGSLDRNRADARFITNFAPNPPSSIVMQNPSEVTGIDVSPTFLVSGVKSGDTIRVFTDSLCSNEVGSSSSSGTTVGVTTNNLAIGTYTIYSNTTNSSGTPSICSTANIIYTLNSCPTDWIRVDGSAIHETDAFCVMKFEAKNVGTVPTSQAANVPWVVANQTVASNTCRSLGVNYDLLSNPEWMTMAHDIEMVDSNWSGSIVGSGCLFRGNAGVTDACGYNTGASDNGTGRDVRASFTLLNGEVIWDLSGNVWEWIDWSKGGSLTQITPSEKAFDGDDGAPSNSGYMELPLIDSNIEAGREMAENSWKPINTTLDSLDGVGKYYAGLNNYGGAPLRGGGNSNGDQTGLYALVLEYEKSGAGVPSFFGFRCVYRP